MKSQEKKEVFKKRPPVVVVLGHVDHGKSSILEAIKDLKITGKESGGITQHIGAYEIEHQKEKITFIDTPGHEAFSTMRSRGASVADIAILVIDACEGIRPQTKEAISVIKKMKIPVIVALNKMDKREANPEKVKRELSENEFFVESMGGEIPSVEISAINKTGIIDLLEVVVLMTDMAELKNDLESPAEGKIIESYMDSLKGPIATLILKKGTLEGKNFIGTKTAYSKIKTLKDFQRKEIKKAYPSQPIIILGFDKVPQIGENFKVYKTAEEALQKIEKHKNKKEGELPSTVFVEKEKQSILNIILKADVLGSLEAVEGILKNLPQEKVILRILKSDVGEINDSDLKLAEMAKAQIIGFRTKINPAVISAVKKYTDKKIKVKTFDIIYELLQYVRTSMDKKIEPEIVRVDLGKIKALVIFQTRKTRQIIGGKIIDGEAKKGVKAEVFRKKEKVGEGKVISLQKNKKTMEKLKKGEECGILYEGNIKVQKEDVLHLYFKEEKKII